LPSHQVKSCKINNTFEKKYFFIDYKIAIKVIYLIKTSVN
jgi:hypothetical protein